MPDLKQGRGFQPSPYTLKLLCGTRKMASNYGGVTLPGLFKTRAFPRDIALFSLVFILEFVGVKMIYDIGEFNPIAFAGVFLLEFTIAIFAHLPQSKRQIISNKLVIEDIQSEKDKLEKEESNLKLISKFLNAILIVIAAFKTYLFIGLYGELDGVALTICVSYGLTAFLQITITGYFLWEIFTIISLRHDYDLFLESDNKKSQDIKAESIPFLISFSVPITEVTEENTVNKHTLLKVGDKYQLITNGLFSDDDLERFVQLQNTPDKKRNVAIELLRVQLTFLKS